MQSDDGNAYFAPINSCVRPICSLHGAALMTVEGLGGKKQGYSTVQQNLAQANGSQCGFCSVGMVMSISAALSEKVDAKEMETR